MAKPMPPKEQPKDKKPPSPPPLKRGESMPPGGMGSIMSGVFAFLFMMVPITACAFLEPMFKPEEVLAKYVHLADPVAAPIAAALFHLFVLQWLAMCVNGARVRYNVPWPTMYVDESHPHAVEYNCAQRAHQHVLEQTPMLIVLLGIASLTHPLTAGAASMLFSFSKVVGNVFGYSKGNSKAKNRGAFGYLGLLALVGLAGLVGLRKAGVADEFITKIEVGVETARPHVYRAMEVANEQAIVAYEAAKPYAKKAAAAAAPYMTKAFKAGEPYVTKVMNASKPYYDKVHDAATPYIEQAKAFMGYE